MCRFAASASTAQMIREVLERELVKSHTFVLSGYSRRRHDRRVVLIHFHNISVKNFVTNSGQGGYNTAKAPGEPLATPKTVNIVIPCYNEAERLPADEILEFVSTRRWLRFTMVDDGSKDETKGILLDLARRSEGRIETLILEQNAGKAEAVRQGFKFAMQGPHWAVGFWDADLATPLKDIEDFTKQLKQDPHVDMVIGSRVQLLGRQITRQLQRHYFGRVAATAASVVLGLNVYDTQCGAKLFRNNSRIQTVFAEPFVTRWIFDVEILARWKGLLTEEGLHDPENYIIEIPLQRWTDVNGSKLSSMDLANAPIELARIYWHYRGVLK